MDPQNELSTVIRRGRERKGLTQEELSQIIHKSDKYIGAVECGRIMPPYAVLKQIVQVLEIDGNTLFYENANEGASKMADIYLRKMDPTTQKLAIELLQTMANFRYPKTHKKRCPFGFDTPNGHLFLICIMLPGVLLYPYKMTISGR